MLTTSCYKRGFKIAVCAPLACGSAIAIVLMHLGLRDRVHSLTTGASLEMLSSDSELGFATLFENLGPGGSDTLMREAILKV